MVLLKLSEAENIFFSLFIFMEKFNEPLNNIIGGLVTDKRNSSNNKKMAQSYLYGRFKNLKLQELFSWIFAQWEHSLVNRALVAQCGCTYCNPSAEVGDRKSPGAYDQWSSLMDRLQIREGPCLKEDVWPSQWYLKLSSVSPNIYMDLHTRKHAHLCARTHNIKDGNAG